MEKMNTFVFIMFFLCFHTVICQQTSYNLTYPDLQRLRYDLFSMYDAEIPAIEPVELYYGISPVNIVDVDPRRGLLTIDLWLRHSWIDPRMMWSSDDYSQNVIFVKNKKLFIPEMELYNGNLSPLNDPEVVVYSTGYMYYYPAVRAEVYCDLPEIPFTGKICSIKIGPWAHNTRQTKILTFDPVVDTVFIYPTGMCRIERTWAKLEEESYPCCVESYGTMTLMVNLTCGEPMSSENRPSEQPSEQLASIGDDNSQTKKFFHNSSIPIFLTPFFILFVFLLPPKPADRAIFGSLVFACLLLLWTSNNHLQTTEKHFIQVSSLVTIAATFLSLATCIMRSAELMTSKGDVYEPKPPGCKSRLARLIDVMLLTVVAVILGVSSAGMFITA